MPRLLVAYDHCKGLFRFNPANMGLFSRIPGKLGKVATIVSPEATPRSLHVSCLPQLPSSWEGLVVDYTHTMRQSDVRERK